MQSKNIITFGILVLAVAALLGFLVWTNNTTPPTNSPSIPATQTSQSESTDESLPVQSETNKDNVAGATAPSSSLNSTEEVTMEKSGKPEMLLDSTKQYSAVIHTSKGDLAIDLFEDASPVTVNNFVQLAQTGYYDGVIFHRVIEDFMIQTGDQTGTGAGNPGYSFEDEFNNYKLVRGSVAMANSGPNTNGSQFFIVTAEATPWLDGKHTNFGRVTSGMAIADEISKVDVDSRDKPLEPITINSIDIIAE